VFEAAGNTFERRPGVRAWPADEPLRTFTTTATRALACPPMLVPVEARPGLRPRQVVEPARVQTGRNETALLVPAGGTWNTDAQPVDVPMRTRTTRETEGVAFTTTPITALIPLRNNNRPKHPAEPLDTFAANGLHHGLATTGVSALAFVMRNNTPRGDAGQMCTPVTEPARTFTTAGHQSLVLYAYDTGRFRTLRRPLPTQTTIEGDALVAVQAGEVDVIGVAVEDCRFRMLTPGEIKLGMAFADNFVLLGTGREQVRMCGNAVTPPVARDLIAAVVEAITCQEVTAA
jgi:DNA (cytosine-5)-methyltransferase 1